MSIFERNQYQEKATALVSDDGGRFSMQDVFFTIPEADEVLVKTLYSGVSIGTEFALIRNKINWGPFPLLTGYMSTGIVERVGDAVDGIRAGDIVFMRQNTTSAVLADGRSLSMVSGLHCSRVVSKVGGTHGLGLLPSDCDPAVASMFVMPAVGYKAVDTSAPKMGESVVVIGCGMIGLGVIAACAMRGCRVIAVDREARALELAKAFGADLLVNASTVDMATAVKTLCPQGADAVFESTGIPALINPALTLCREEGKFIWQGNYGTDLLGLSFIDAHVRRLQMFFPCDDGYMPSRLTVLKHMATGLLPWHKAITHRIASAEAASIYTHILQGDHALRGIVISWE